MDGLWPKQESHRSSPPLGTLYIARGAALLISQGKTFPNLAGSAAHHNTGLPAIGQGAILRVPVPVWIMLALFAVARVYRDEDTLRTAHLRSRRQ